MKKILSILLLLAITLSLFACSVQTENNKTITATVVTNSGQTKQMTLQEIKEISESNSLLFEKEYVGADIKVTSTITKIGGSFELTSWFKCEAYVELDASSNMGCWFHPVREEYALTLNVGDEITVAGKIGSCTVSGFDVYILYDAISPYGDNQNTNNNGNNQTPSTEGAWVTGNYVDEFDSPTGMAYVATEYYLTGTFSNSATTDSKLYAQLVIDIENGEPRVAIFLYEYGNLLVKNSYSKAENYEITMLCSNGSKVKLKGYMYSGGDRIFIEESGFDYGTAQSVINELCSSGESIKLHIVDTDRTTTQYLFAVPKSNFQEEYKKISNGVVPGGNNGGNNSGNNGGSNTPQITVDCDQPVEGKCYVLFLYQGHIEKNLYVCGGMDSYYLATTEIRTNSIHFQVEKVGNGYHLFHTTWGQKEYLNIIQSNGHVNVAYESEPNSIYRYDATLKTFVTEVDGVEYFMGSMTKYSFLNLAPCKAASASDYFISHFSEEDCSSCNKPDENGHTHDWLSSTCTEPRICLTCGATSGEPRGHSYEAGTCSRCGVKTKISIYSIYEKEYVTGTEYLHTTSNGITKLEFELSNNKNDALAFTVVDNGDGTISFQLDNGMYLYCDANDVTFSAAQSDYTKFVLEKVSDGYYIRCAVANYNGKPQYLEVYRGYLTCYSISSTSDLSMYTFKLENIN